MRPAQPEGSGAATNGSVAAPVTALVSMKNCGLSAAPGTGGRNKRAAGTTAGCGAIGGTYTPLSTARYAADNAVRLLEALGVDPAHGVLRLSFVHYNSPQEMTRVLHALDELL